MVKRYCQAGTGNTTLPAYQGDTQKLILLISYMDAGIKKHLQKSETKDSKEVALLGL